MLTPKHHPNSYWVHPGRLLAGEYPGHADEAKAREKLARFLSGGIDCFIDLTEEGELVAYDDLLIELAGARGVQVEYHRHPIRDVSIPRHRKEMIAILDRIDAGIGAGRTVYVHCWGGTGRTGTVIGCHLVRRGMTGGDALAHVLELWRKMEKAPSKYRSPETDQQRDYVRHWQEERAIENPL